MIKSIVKRTFCRRFEGLKEEAVSKLSFRETVVSFDPSNSAREPSFWTSILNHSTKLISKEKPNVAQRVDFLGRILDFSHLTITPIQNRTTGSAANTFNFDGMAGIFKLAKSSIDVFGQIARKMSSKEEDTETEEEWEDKVRMYVAYQLTVRELINSFMNEIGEGKVPKSAILVQMIELEAFLEEMSISRLSTLCSLINPSELSTQEIIKFAETFPFEEFHRSVEESENKVFVYAGILKALERRIEASLATFEFPQVLRLFKSLVDSKRLSNKMLLEFCGVFIEKSSLNQVRKGDGVVFLEKLCYVGREAENVDFSILAGSTERFVEKKIEEFSETEIVTLLWVNKHLQLFSADCLSLLREKTVKVLKTEITLRKQGKGRMSDFEIESLLQYFLGEEVESLVNQLKGYLKPKTFWEKMKL